MRLCSIAQCQGEAAYEQISTIWCADHSYIGNPVEPGRLRTGEKDNEVELSLRGGVPSGGTE
jgi:hypothetical protein